jgi:hypothetical protein
MHACICTFTDILCHAMFSYPVMSSSLLSIPCPVHRSIYDSNPFTEAYHCYMCRYPEGHPLHSILLQCSRTYEWLHPIDKLYQSLVSKHMPTSPSDDTHLFIDRTRKLRDDALDVHLRHFNQFVILSHEYDDDNDPPPVHYTVTRPRSVSSSSSDTTFDLETC